MKLGGSAVSLQALSSHVVWPWWCILLRGICLLELRMILSMIDRTALDQHCFCSFQGLPGNPADWYISNQLFWPDGSHRHFKGKMLAAASFLQATEYSTGQAALCALCWIAGVRWPCGPHRSIL